VIRRVLPLVLTLCGIGRLGAQDTTRVELRLFYADYRDRALKDEHRSAVYGDDW